MSRRRRLVRILPWGLLGGILLTFAFLGHMAWKQLPDCRQTIFGPRLTHPLAGCATLEEGYPLRFLSSRPWVEQDTGRTSSIAAVSIGGEPVIHGFALAGDWLVWSVASCGVLYLLVPSGRKAREVRAAEPSADAGA
jgi:hypothetical protein